MDQRIPYIPDNTSKIFGLASLLVFCLLLSAPALAQNEKARPPSGEKTGRIDIENKLGEHIPKDIELLDEDGQKVELDALVDKPTILTLVYFRCPGICTPLLNELRRIVEMVQLEPGKDFQIVSVSFDHREGPEIARKKRDNYLSQMKRKFPARAWRFLTGDKENIKKLTKAVGFHYRKEGNEYRHAGSLIVLSPDGKISRYIYGLEYLPTDLQMALVKASNGQIEPTIPKFLRFCFSYDPQGKRLGLNITNISMVVIGFGILAFALVLFLSGPKQSNDDKE